MKNQIWHWDFERGWQRGPVIEVGTLSVKQAVENTCQSLEKCHSRDMMLREIILEVIAEIKRLGKT